MRAHRFFSKHSLSVVYTLWDFLLVSGIQDFIFYVVLALLIHNRDRILKESPITLPQTISSLNIPTQEELFTLLNLYLSIVTSSAYTIFCRTPDSFKETVRTSCVYNTRMDKELARKSLEAFERLGLVTLDTDELLSTANAEYCARCIRGRRSHTTRLNAAGSLPHNSYHPSVALAARPMSSGIALATEVSQPAPTKSFVEIAKRKTSDGESANERPACCKICSKEIVKRTMIELVGPSSAPIFSNTFHIPLKDAGKGVAKLLSSSPVKGSLGVIVISDRNPELLKRNNHTPNMCVVCKQLLRQNTRYLAISSSPSIESLRQELKQQTMRGTDERVDTMFGSTLSADGALPVPEERNELARVSAQFLSRTGFAPLKPSKAGKSPDMSAPKKKLSMEPPERHGTQKKDSTKEAAGPSLLNRSITRVGSPPARPSGKGSLGRGEDFRIGLHSTYYLCHGIVAPLLMPKVHVGTKRIGVDNAGPPGERRSGTLCGQTAARHGALRLLRPRVYFRSRQIR